MIVGGRAGRHRPGDRRSRVYGVTTTRASSRRLCRVRSWPQLADDRAQARLARPHRRAASVPCHLPLLRGEATVRRSSSAYERPDSADPCAPATSGVRGADGAWRRAPMHRDGWDRGSRPSSQSRSGHGRRSTAPSASKTWPATSMPSSISSAAKPQQRSFQVLRPAASRPPPVSQPDPALAERHGVEHGSSWSRSTTEHLTKARRHRSSSSSRTRAGSGSPAGGSARCASRAPKVHSGRHRRGRIVLAVVGR